MLIHTGDFKIDQTPLGGEPFDLHRFAQLGAEGVLAMFGDSTNIDRRGYTGSELDVEDAFEEIFTSTEGKLVVAAFASSIYRMQILVDLAVQFDRKVAFVGRGMNENSQIAQRLGYLRVPAGTLIRDSDVPNYPSQDVLCLVTGSQGEANAALSRIAIDDHRYVKLAPPDRVVISARAIPGNEKAIGRVMNHIARRGVDVITESTKHVHVSGHGAEEELKLLLALVRPRYFVPIHGEYRQLARHARVAELVTGGLPTAGGCHHGGERRRDPLRSRRARASSTRRSTGPRADRRHARRRSRRRGAARSAPSGGRRRRGAGRGDQPADRRRRYASRRSSRAASSPTANRTPCWPRARG